MERYRLGLVSVQVFVSLMRRANSPKVVFWKKSFLSYFGVGCWFIKSFNENRGSMSKIRHVFKRVLFPVPLPVLREVSAELENKTNLFFSTADFAGNDLEDVATMTKTRWVDVPSASPQAVALNRRLVVPMERRPGNTLSERSARGAFNRCDQLAVRSHPA